MEATQESKYLAHFSHQVNDDADDEASSSSSSQSSPSHRAQAGSHLSSSSAEKTPRVFPRVFGGLPLNGGSFSLPLNGGSFNQQSPRVVAQAGSPNLSSSSLEKEPVVFPGVLLHGGSFGPQAPRVVAQAGPAKEPRVFPGLPLNRGSFNHQAPRIVVFPPHQCLGTSILRRSVSEGPHTPDSGVSFITPSGLHNAKVSARAMDRALSNKLKSSDPTLVKKLEEYEDEQGQKMATTIDKSEQKTRKNSLKSHRGPDLASLPRTARLNQDQTKREGNLLSRFAFHRCHHTAPENEPDALSARLKFIEQADQSTKKRNLDDHLGCISRVLEEMPQLSKGPRRNVDVVVRPERRDREEAGVFGHVGKDKEGAKKEKKENKLKKMLGRAKTLCQRRRFREEA